MGFAPRRTILYVFICLPPSMEGTLFLPTVWASYQDERLLNDLMRVTTLEIEPVIAAFAVDVVLPFAPGNGFPADLARNQDAIRKTTAGLLKLIYPHRTADDIQPDELSICTGLAFECRQRTVEQLAIQAPGEFQNISWQSKAE
jgi:hypothetical protein